MINRTLWAAVAAVSAVTFAPSSSFAQEASAAARPASTLAADVEDFWHFARIARYDAANAKAQAIVESGANPADVLAAFEAVVAKRGGNDLSPTIARFMGIPELAENVAAVEKILAEGRYARRGDAGFITANIDRLITNEIGYSNGLANLQNSGEMAVPLLLEYLRSPSKAQYHDAVRRALRDMGRTSLNPLVAATEATEAETLVNVVTLLGDLGYRDAAPYLLKVQSTTQSATIRDAASRALAKLGGAGAADAAFFELAEKFYYGRSAIAADNRNPEGFVWFWSEQSGLNRRDVPQDVFGEIMAMRAAEYALQLAGASSVDVSDRAMSLWLTANYKREIELGDAADPTRAPGQPSAHYYGVTSGPKYLGAALARALSDKDSAVAYEILRSAQEIVGASTLNVGSEGDALVLALSYPDRRVRFESAFALASAGPESAFTGSDLVVPLLGEALSQTGQPTVVVLAGDTDRANAIAAPLTAGGYQAVATTTAADAGAAARSLAAVDVVVFDGTLPADQVEGIIAQLTTSPKFRGAARLALVQTNQSAFEERKAIDPLLSTSTATEPDAIKAAVDAARAGGGALPVEPDVATDYALRAAAQLRQIGLGGGSVYNLGVAKPALLTALSDARPEVVKADGEVLAVFDDADAQRALLGKAGAADTSAELRVALYKSLAANAKRFGNRLNGEEVANLETAVTDEADLDIRAAAAEARGALNLSADQAKSIILKQVQR